MIELTAVFAFEGVHQPPQPHFREAKYQRQLKRGPVSLVIHGDEPVDSFVFDCPEFSMICRADLQQSQSDVSAAAHIANLYRLEGDAFAVRLRGSFAVVLHDYRTNTLKAWTDHFGVERLVYADFDNCVGIATDLRLLVAMSDRPPEIDPAAILQYLQYSAVPTPKTIYKGIHKLAPGHSLACKPRPATRQYWDLRYNENLSDPKNESRWAEDTLNSIRDSVALTLKGVDPSRLGCFLSGGTDSSSVTGLVGELTRKSPKSFSIGFDDPRYNEIHFARLAAKRYQAEHHEYFVTPDDILALIQKAPLAYDEPFGNSSIIPTYYCARLAAENGVSHLLAGDGGDELFGGNARYVEDQIFQHYGRIPQVVRRALLEPVIAVGRSAQLPLFDKAAKYVRRASLSQADRVFSYTFLSSVANDELFTPGFLSNGISEHPLTPARSHFTQASAQSDLNRWMYLDVKMILTDNDLRKVTTMSRLAGVTTRYPLLTPPLAEFSGTIPSELKVKGNQLRYLFKKAMSGILPQEIIKKTKHGFGLPYSVWVGEYKPLRDFTFDVLGSTKSRERGYFRKDLLEWLWLQYETVHRSFYGEVLWIFLMLELWMSSQHDRLQRPESDLVPSAGRAF
jgi:asparagine synthase (glutamine-hydrolysing)